MEMNEVLSLLPAVFAGIVLGVLFFGGLWLTVRKGLDSKNATLIFMGSLIIRMAIVLLGFYYVGADNWQKMMACLGGFLIARIVITRITKKEIQTKPTIIKKVNDEN
ncbi:F1/F0 ATPase, subunit 2 [Aequorivita viscosa]|uniref:F1/F0 ATPase, subunit 2 n=2 Tax=Aequorivita viscosa TaxID=797419 RepID=A0A1M6EPA3_9FLAO|nr:F1/F0 ATPase, subunit 2 [Aequorivita viscosa]SHI87317.1 F1/F0 ATPase, subunit 2 [Aequorivita viscosa]